MDPTANRNSSSAVTVPVIPATSLTQVSLAGSVSSGGNDRLDLASGTTHYMVTSPDSTLSLANYWTTAEFTIVGDCCLYMANFDANSSLAVRTTVHNSTTSAPTCVVTGFTGETNNLNLVSTPAVGTQAAPTLISDQTSTTGTAACAVASGTGDTHLHTFTPTLQANTPTSGLRYDFQAQGEFILAKSDDGFEVQTRQISGAPTWPNAAVNEAIATKIGRSVVVISAATKALQVFINGALFALADGATHILPNEGDVRRSGNVYTVRDMKGNSVQVNDQPAATHYLDVAVGLGHWPNIVQGLLVSAKGNVNAVVARTGAVFPAPFNFANFYGAYGDSWRVAGEKSLFTPVTRELPALKLTNPAQPFYANDIGKVAYQAAKTNCQRAGVKANTLDDCILDVAVIGDKKAALSHVHPRLPASAARAIIFKHEEALPIRPER